MDARLELRVQLSGKTLSKHAFDEQPRIVVGRARECDVVIDNLAVSRTHFEILREGRGYVLQDLGSNNGTSVNGHRVSAWFLNDGDEIAVGKFRIAVVAPILQQPVEPERPAAPPRPLSGDFTMSMDPATLQARAAAEKASRVKAYLTRGEGRRSDSKVLDRPVFTIGNWAEADLRAGGFFTARRHALVVRDELGFLLVDGTGRRRTYLNGTAVDVERLHDGDKIGVGDTVVQFRVGTPDY